jgi:nucleosome binding factor SPN SPT16 subunit
VQSPNSFVPIQIVAQAKPKDPPTDALPTFTNAYSQLKRVGILSKEQVSGKLIDEWNKTLATIETKPETADVSAAISSLLAVKDEEELVSLDLRGLCGYV